MADVGGRSAIARTLKAVSCGPFGLIQSAIVGFIAGTIAFVIGYAIVAEQNPVEALPLLVTLAFGAAAGAIVVATAANYVIGRRIRDETELRAKILAGEVLVPPIRRADLPGIDLLARSGRPASDARVEEPEARTREVA